MCKCTPNIRTPFCGKEGCEVPENWKEPNKPEDVKPGTVWVHHKGGRYIVTGIFNEGNPVLDDNNPPIVSYLAVQGDGTPYARELSKWFKSFVRA